MCASAILQAGFREYVYGTSINHLFQSGWDQILIPSSEVVSKGWPLAKPVKVLGSVGTQFTDGLFEWQFQEHTSCPKGCERMKGVEGSMTCTPIV
jgi:tRNA(Arg) A34 adenosine deaminase TadA